MSFFHGLGMFIFGMSATIFGAIVAYFIINKVMENKKEKTRWDDLE
jgi:phage shock protein PspC (stress-responsive transcriptional regulator)